MLLPTWPLLAFLFLFPLEWNAEALSFKSLKRQSNESANAKDEKSKQVAFDQQGILYVFIYFVFRINVLKKCHQRDNQWPNRTNRCGPKTVAKVLQHQALLCVFGLP